MTIEQLRREVIREVRWYSNTRTPDQISRVTSVRAAFDAYDKAVIAANKPTFEGDEAEVRKWFRAMPDVGLAHQALALLDAKDAEIAGLTGPWSPAERWKAIAEGEVEARVDIQVSFDAALSRAEQAEAALAERDAAIVEAVDALQRGKPCGAHAKLVPFLPAKPAVDPLIAVLTEALQDAIGPKDALAVRAAIERAGGVKAVFGEGV